MRNYALFTLIALALLATSCEKEPDTDKLDNDYLVYTNYDKNVNFEELNYIHVIDSILIIDDNAKPTYWNNDNSDKVVNAFIRNLEEYGYTIVENSDVAEMVLQLSYVSNTYYFNNYGAGPWWNSYPGYWNWGGWGWYYPYSFIYSYSTGSIIGELVGTTPSTVASDKLPVLWNTYICGLLNGNSLSLSRTLTAIDQAFTQSPYLDK
ncbi:MAG: DUF4136 domain-containing protein [Bacteroidaceae bacterium]|nr:DUF4136 domain-containing protein [Bacteroidaceae bacterium]